MRKTLRCPKCQHNRILFLTQVADRIGDIGPGAKVTEEVAEGPERALSEPWRLARVRVLDSKWWQADTGVAGVAQAYVCKGCGYTEWYTRDPGSIPVDGTIVKEVVGPPADGPFR